MIRVELPSALRVLARLEREVTVEVHGAPTLRSLLDALETRHPALRGTLRDYDTGQRRKLVRFFACEEDLSHCPLDTPLPGPVAEGREPLLIVGAIAGG